MTKMLRKEYGLEKTHCNDARAISGNPGAVPVQGCSFKSRKIANHTRSLHVAKPAEGGKRRSKIAPHKIGNSRFQRFDMVEWNGIKCFIYGSTGGRPVLKDMDGKRVTPTTSVNIKTIKFIRRKRKGIIIQKLK